jgi:translation initiation factor 2B subunit (eIF-2B alpha/beta/delta family)
LCKIFLIKSKKLAYVVGGLHNSTKFVKNILQKIQNNKNIDRELILNKLDEFINTKINTKDIISYKHGTNLIKENDYILIYGKSQIFRKILTKAVQKKINFKVIYVDNKQNNYSKYNLNFFS